jgi:hypothetical protein
MYLVFSIILPRTWVSPIMYSLNYALGLPHYLGTRGLTSNSAAIYTDPPNICEKNNQLELLRSISDSIWTEIIVVAPFHVRALRLLPNLNEVSNLALLFPTSCRS